MDSSENKGPSVAELQKFIREKTRVEFILTNGNKFVGTLRWFDTNAFSLIEEDKKPITLLRSAVLAYRCTN